MKGDGKGHIFSLWERRADADLAAQKPSEVSSFIESRLPEIRFIDISDIVQRDFAYGHCIQTTIASSPKIRGFQFCFLFKSL
jgi:hypothetical protein